MEGAPKKTEEHVRGRERRRKNLALNKEGRSVRGTLFLSERRDAKLRHVFARKKRKECKDATFKERRYWVTLYVCTRGCVYLSARERANDKEEEQLLPGTLQQAEPF